MRRSIVLLLVAAIWQYRRGDGCSLFCNVCYSCINGRRSNSCQTLGGRSQAAAAAAANSFEKTVVDGRRM